jgi:hypothetical protein
MLIVPSLKLLENVFWILLKIINQKNHLTDYNTDFFSQKISLEYFVAVFLNYLTLKNIFIYGFYKSFRSI